MDQRSNEAAVMDRTVAGACAALWPEKVDWVNCLIAELTPRARKFSHNSNLVVKTELMVKLDG